MSWFCFRIRLTPTSHNELGNIPSSSIFLEKDYKIGFNSSSDYPEVLSGHGEFLYKSFTITNSISLTFIELFKWSISYFMSYSIFFQGIFLFCQSASYVYTGVCNISLWFCLQGLYCYSFHYTGNLCLPSFLCQSYQEFVNSVELFKESALGFTFSIFLFAISLISAL